MPSGADVIHPLQSGALERWKLKYPKFIQITTADADPVKGVLAEYGMSFANRLKEPGGKKLTQELVKTAREKFEKLVITNKLTESNDGEYCDILEKRFTSCKERDCKSKGGSMYLRWTLFNEVDRMFFFGDGLLCFVNGCYVQIVDNLLTEPNCLSFNLLSGQVITGTSKTENGNQYSGVQFVLGCPYTPLLAYVKENSSTIYLLIYPKMKIVAMLKSHTGDGSYIGLDFGLCEHLYALRGQPDCTVEIWNTGSLSLIMLIPGAYYTNNIAIRTSLLNNHMVIVDIGSQCVIMWALHSTSSADLLVCPRVVQAPPKLDAHLVDAAFSFDGDLFLLTEKGHIYLVGENKEATPCCLVENNKVYNRLLESNSKGALEQNSRWVSLFWHNDCLFARNVSHNVLVKYKIVSRMKFELLDMYSITGKAHVAVDSRSGVFKATSLLSPTSLAIWDGNGLKLTKPNSRKLSEVLTVPRRSSDLSILAGHVIIVEKRCIRFMRIRDGSMVTNIPMPQDLHKVLIHPRLNFLIVSGRNHGTLFLFHIINHEVKFIEKFQLFDCPIEMMVFSLRGDALAIGTHTGNVGLFMIGNEALLHPVTIMSTDHHINSLSFMNMEGTLLLATVANGSDGTSTIYFYEVPTLNSAGIVELSEELYQIVESRLENVIYGTSLSGLSAVSFSFYSRKGDIYLQRTETLEYYDQICWRRLLSDWNSLVIYGTDGSLDIFIQGDELRRVFSTKTESYNGFVSLSICPKLKFIVGLLSSGVILCQSLKLSSSAKDKFVVEKPSPSESHMKNFYKGDVGFKQSTRSLFEASLDKEAVNLKNEGFAYKFVQRHLITIMSTILEEIASLEISMKSLNQSYQEQLKDTFLSHVTSRNLMAMKYRNLEKLNRKQLKEIVQITDEIDDILDSYSKRYSDVFHDHDVSTNHLIDRKEYAPTTTKGNHELVFNFYNSSTSVIQEGAVDHVLLYCTDNITISCGFDKYISPRWLRNAGPGAEILSLTIHSKKKKGADGDEKRKFDLNRKITEAVTNLGSYFLKKRELEEQCNLVEVVTNDDDKATDSSLPQMKIVDSTKPSAECFLVNEERIEETLQDSEPSAATSVCSGGSPEIIFDASDDGTEEGCISSESMSSGTSYEMEQSGDRQRGPGDHSGYLIKLLERKEAKKTEKFELKDGILKYYHQLPENIKEFTRKFHGSSSHIFLHAFPLCLCSDEMESILINCIQFSYSQYFVEALREHFNANFDNTKTEDELSTYQEEVEESSLSIREYADEEEDGKQQGSDESKYEENFLIEPLKPASPLMTALELSDLKTNEEMMQYIEICPAIWDGSDKLENLLEWMERAMAPQCLRCQKKKEESKKLSIVCKTSLEALPSREEITNKRLSKSMQQIIGNLMMDSRTEPAHQDARLNTSICSTSDVLLRFKWPEITPSENIPPHPTPGDETNQGGSYLLSLLEESNKFSLYDAEERHVRYDMSKRRKWYVQAQVSSETVQLALKNHRAQMIRKLMDDMAMVRFFITGIAEYLRILSEASSQIVGLFKDVLQSYFDFKQPLNELNHMKKVLNHICRKYNVPGLSQHVERMDSFKIEIQDAGSAEYLEDIIRTQMLFSGDTDDSSFFKHLHNDHEKHFCFSANLRRTRFRLWETYFSWKKEAESSEEETLKGDPNVSGNFRDDIFQLATDFHMVAIALHLTVRSLLLRLKSFHEAAVNIKKQYQLYKNYSIKLKLLESSLECCVKEWIAFQRELLTFKTADLYKSNASQDLSVLSTLVPTDYMGWELPLLASRADKILLRKVKKKNNHQNKTPGNTLAARAPRTDGGMSKKAPRAGKNHSVLQPGTQRFSVSDEQMPHRMRRRQSKATDQRTKLDWDASQNSIRKSASHRGKCCFDAFLDEFVQHLEEVGEKGVLDEMKIPDFASTLQDDAMEEHNWDRSSATDLSECDAKVVFCEKPIYTNITHISHQDHQINLLQNEYYGKLLSLIKSKDDFRKNKAEISNVRTKMINLLEEYATIKKYIVSRDETHLVTNLSTISDSLKESRIHHETQSQKLNAEVKRSLRLIKKGKFEATEWLMGKLLSSADQNRLSDEEQVSKKSSSVSDQLKSSYRSEHGETSSASIANLTNEAEKEVSWEASNYRSTSHGSPTNTEKSKKLDAILAMTLLLGEKKVLYGLCRFHCKTVPPFCCLEEIFLSMAGSSSSEHMVKPEMELNANDFQNREIFLKNEELINVLRGFRTTQRMPECEFPSYKEEQLMEIESSSHQSSLKIEATLGSWSDSELEEALDSTTLSIRDKMDSAVEKLLENKSEIIRHLTHKYIIEKCGELFVDKCNQQIEEGEIHESDCLRLMRRAAESELTEYHQDLMSLHQECSSRKPIVYEETNKKTVGLYEARLRSETLRDIRNLKDRIKEKQISIVKLEEELERRKMRKYPTFDI